MFHEVSPANAGMQPQHFCLASWNIGGGSEQMVLDLLANIRGRAEFENLQVLCLQEVDTKPGLHFAEDRPPPPTPMSESEREWPSSDEHHSTEPDTNAMFQHTRQPPRPDFGDKTTTTTNSPTTITTTTSSKPPPRADGVWGFVAASGVNGHSLLVKFTVQPSPFCQHDGMGLLKGAGGRDCLPSTRPSKAKQRESDGKEREREIDWNKVREGGREGAREGERESLGGTQAAGAYRFLNVRNNLTPTFSCSQVCLLILVRSLASCFVLLIGILFA